MPPQLTGFDHIHLYVTDKHIAANWYAENLGFHIVDSLLPWDTANGPLTIEDESKQIHLALFEKERFSPLTAIAFKTNGKDFLAWKKHLESLNILDRCADHQLAWSLYFHDPYGHSHEITTYQVETVNEVLK